VLINYIQKGTDKMIYVGIDVASNKHDCYLMDDRGEAYSPHSLFLMMKKDIKSFTTPLKIL